MKFYRPKFRIASMEGPQTKFQSKFGGLPWGLPSNLWRWCNDCKRPMSLLAQLSHDPPALDFGEAQFVLHLFQCQECFGYDSGQGNDAVFIRSADLNDGLTTPPEPLEPLVGELWLEGWSEQDDGLDPALAEDLFSQDEWMELPEPIVNSMFELRDRTKMGGVPYWTGNGPLQELRTGYQYLFQIDNYIEFDGTPPSADEVGGTLVIVNAEDEQEYHEPDADKKKTNAPWSIVTQHKGKYHVEITNLGTDGTAYVLINRSESPPRAYWFWNR